MFRKPLFWIVFALVFIASVLFIVRYFSSAFPIVTLDLSMDRTTALESAAELAQQQNWGPTEYKQAASFRLDTSVQNFVELEGGGVKAFRDMLGNDLYSPYTWNVRHFKEGETNETRIYFRPDGRPYGFVEKLAEEAAGASLSGDSARVIAENSALKTWMVNLKDYDLVEDSQEIRPGGRIDHTFVYERPDVRIGEGRYRLRLVVGGDKLVEFRHFIKIPEAFSRRYTEMRSFNNTIAIAAFVGMAIFYVFGGCMIGLFLLIRQGWVLWRKPLFWGLFIAFLQVLVDINQWPLDWMNYDTALSMQGYWLRQLTQLLVTFVATGFILTVSFMTAESLSRKAFPSHIQFWRLWSSDVASSPDVAGRTVSGYLLVGLFWAFIVGFYFFTNKILGWWTPSEALFHPDILATYFPWLSSIAISLHAGFWEECMFRAIPIAGAALLGQRFGYRNVWIFAAFILQALIFSGGHANYPQQPSYARLVELIIPSLVFGLVYLFFGLLPAIVLHFSVDVVAFALPLFVSSAPGIWIDRMMVVLLTLVPVWVLIYARIRKRTWRAVEEKDYNRSWKPLKVELEPEQEVDRVEVPEKIRFNTRPWILAGGIVGLVLWILRTQFQSDSPSLTVSRHEAHELATEALQEHGVTQEGSWKLYSRVDIPVNMDDRFVWQQGGREKYHELIKSYLSPPQWRCRYVTFQGDVAERAEEYHVFISQTDSISRIRHIIPEAREGARISEAQAREIAFSVLADKFKLDINTIKEVSVVPSKLSGRMDWLFTFADTLSYPLKEGEARLDIKIAGDKVVDYYRYIHIPEEWERQERDRQNIIRISQVIGGMLLFLLFLAGSVAAGLKWRRKKFTLSVFLCFAILLFVLGIMDIVNSWPYTISYFSTAEPLKNQIFTSLAFSIILLVFVSSGPALVMGFLYNWIQKRYNEKFITLLVTGFSLGLFVTGFLSLLPVLFDPLQKPFWSDYSSLNNIVPLLSTVFGPLQNYVIETILILLVLFAITRFTKGWTEKRFIFSVVFIIFVFVLNGITVENLSFWFFKSLIMGFVFLILYHFVLFDNLAFIPLVVGCIYIFNAIENALINAFPAAIPGAVLSSILIAVISVYWTKMFVRG